MATTLEKQHYQQTLPNKAYFGRMETSFQKIKKGTSYYISIADWPHKSHSLFYTQEGTASTMFDMPDTLHH